MPKTVTLVVPDGYASGEDFAKDCGFEIAPEAQALLPIAKELRDQATRLTATAYNPSEARALRAEWRAADEIGRLSAALAPFAAIGGLLAMAGDGIPDGASARFLRLDGLTALEFKEAHKTFVASTTAL